MDEKVSLEGAMYTLLIFLLIFTVCVANPCRVVRVRRAMLESISEWMMIVMHFGVCASCWRHIKPLNIRLGIGRIEVFDSWGLRRLRFSRDLAFSAYENSSMSKFLYQTFQST